MVVICLPTASLTGTPQERVATPLMCTVQAPHCAMPQPYLVPVSPAFSRIAHSSGVSASTSTLKVLPLIVRFAIADPLISSIHRLNFKAMLDWNPERFKSRFCVCRKEDNVRRKEDSPVAGVTSLFGGVTSLFPAVRFWSDDLRRHCERSEAIHLAA